MVQLRATYLMTYIQCYHKLRQMPTYTAPLQRACRDDRNGYIICLHQSPFARDMK
jgi:hypothetical protein